MSDRCKIHVAYDPTCPACQWGPKLGGQSELPATPCSGVFEECRQACPYHVRTPNGGGGIQHDCSHPENCPHLPTEQTPCDPRVCPIFTSDDEDGDYENCRYEHEIEGKWNLPNSIYWP